DRGLCGSRGPSSGTSSAASAWSPCSAWSAARTGWVSGGAASADEDPAGLPRHVGHAQLEVAAVGEDQLGVPRSRSVVAEESLRPADHGTRPDVVPAL